MYYGQSVDSAHVYFLVRFYSIANSIYAIKVFFTYCQAIYPNYYFISLIIIISSSPASIISQNRSNIKHIILTISFSFVLLSDFRAFGELSSKSYN